MEDGRKEKIQKLLAKKNGVKNRRKLAELDTKRYSFTEIRDWKREARRKKRAEGPFQKERT